MSVSLLQSDAAIEDARFLAVTPGHPLSQSGPIWIVEEASGHLRPQNRAKQTPVLNLYKLHGDTLTSVAEVDLSSNENRADQVVSLLQEANAMHGVVLCSFRTASVSKLLQRLEPRLLQDYVLELDPSRPVEFSRARGGILAATPRERLESAKWSPVTLRRTASEAECYAANLGEASIGGVTGLRCFAVSLGGIDSYQRGLLVGATSLSMQDVGLSRLAQLLAWTRWIRIAVRRHKRSSPRLQVQDAPQGKRTELLAGVSLKVRANRRIAHNLDLKSAQQSSLLDERLPELKKRLTASKRTLNVVELFAGAGGMGLGFLSAASTGRSYCIAASAEIHPTYAYTLSRNHEYMVQQGLCSRASVPVGTVPMDLCKPSTRRALATAAHERGDVDVLIGGPPCQGFSNANRNSWSSSNPNNRLVDAFLDCVALLGPRVLLMENVQGILWTPREEGHSKLSVASHVLKRLGAMGYLVFPKLLDAVWYGVPQNRNRFFLLGIHREVGYRTDDFGDWGPFPRPTHGPGTPRAFVTVRDAIADLPRIGNGEARSEIPYSPDPSAMTRNAFLRAMRTGAPEDIIWDHVTSKHSPYVIDRYKAIPQGGNWESVRELMTNYADVSRTHSNIYRRLAMSEPAITIGHYRKSMIVHPTQDRGLSLREAARLQSFPDWFRFASSPTSVEGGLMHKQQQLANAVCPNVTKAVAEYILDI